MPTTEKTTRALRDALFQAYCQAAAERDKAKLVTAGYDSRRYERLAGKVEGLGVARRLVETLCQ